LEITEWISLLISNKKFQKDIPIFNEILLVYSSMDDLIDLITYIFKYDEENCAFNLKLITNIYIDDNGHRYFGQDQFFCKDYSQIVEWITRDSSYYHKYYSAISLSYSNNELKVINCY